TRSGSRGARPQRLGRVRGLLAVDDDRAARVAPADGAIGHVDRVDTVELQPLAGLRRPSAGQANDVQVLVQVQLAVAQLQLGQGEVLRALGVPLRALIGLADVRQLD